MKTTNNHGNGEDGRGQNLPMTDTYKGPGSIVS